MVTFALLPLLLHVVSGFLVGPREITGGFGNSVTVSCYYSNISANIHGRKYWCKMYRNACYTIISTSGYTAEGHVNRTYLEVTRGSFQVQMTKLQHEDAGHYRCGIGSNNNAYYYKVTLNVLEGRILSSEFYFGSPRGSLNIYCPTTLEATSRIKYFCKMGRTGCFTIVNNEGLVYPALWGRVLIEEHENKIGFSVLLKNLKNTDSGFYRCGTGSFEEGLDWKDVHIYVNSGGMRPTTSKAVYGLIGGSISAACNIPKEFSTDALMYWCKWRETGCLRLVDSNGFIQNGFKGKIILDAYNQSKGFYHIIITNLKLGDTGWYWCVITDGHKEHTVPVELCVRDNTSQSNYKGEYTKISRAVYTTPFLRSTDNVQDNHKEHYPNSTSGRQHNIASSLIYTPVLPTTVSAQDNSKELYFSSSGRRSSVSIVAYSNQLPATVTAQDGIAEMYHRSTSIRQHGSASDLTSATVHPSVTSTTQDSITEITLSSTSRGQHSNGTDLNVIANLSITGIVQENSTQHYPKITKRRLKNNVTSITAPLWRSGTAQDNSTVVYPRNPNRRWHNIASKVTSVPSDLAPASTRSTKTRSKEDHNSMATTEYWWLEVTRSQHNVSQQDTVVIMKTNNATKETNAKSQVDHHEDMLVIIISAVLMTCLLSVFMVIFIVCKLHKKGATNNAGYQEAVQVPHTNLEEVQANIEDHESIALCSACNREVSQETVVASTHIDYRALFANSEEEENIKEESDTSIFNLAHGEELSGETEI